MLREFNLNEYVYVKLNAEGFKILEDNYKAVYTNLDGSYSELLTKYPWQAPAVDKDGYCKFQTWHFMQEFGPHIRMGFTNPFDLRVKLEFPNED